MNTQTRSRIEETDPREKAAVQLLKRAGIKSVPVPIEQIAKFMDAQLRYAAFEDDLSGLLYREEVEGGNDVVTVIGVNVSHPPRRRRFTIAHEIGHLVLNHLDKTGFDPLHIDRKFPCLPRNGTSAKGVNRLEIEANSFAAALLMPAKQLREDFKKFRADSIECFDYEDDELASALAKRYNVSLQAMIIRLTRLGLIEGDNG